MAAYEPRDDVQSRRAHAHHRDRRMSNGIRYNGDEVCVVVIADHRGTTSGSECKRGQQAVCDMHKRAHLRLQNSEGK